MLEDTGVDRYDDLDDKYNSTTGDYDAENHLFPYCVVWTPIPFITWFFPFIGHMGIGTSRGIIRDFAGSYYVSENNMGFGWPTMYWQLSPLKVIGGPDVFDRAVRDASDEYKSRMHNLFCDNCHSHVANALNRMAYNNRKNYNMVNLCFMMMYHGKYVGWSGVIKQWLPMAILLLCIFGVVMSLALVIYSKMVRITHELVEETYQYINSINEREVNLRNNQIPAIENLGATRDFFDTIDLSDNNIRKLENLPVLKRLSMLLIHNNRIQQIENGVGASLPNLKTLALTNNNLCELGDIDALASCPRLEYLSLIGNPLTHKAHYRLYVVSKLPSVRVLDFKRVKLAERAAARKLFKGKKGEKLNSDLGQKTVILTESDEVAAAVKKVRPEDAAKIQEAIKNAKSLREVEELQAMLQSGKVPEAGWKPRGAADQGSMEEPMDQE